MILFYLNCCLSFKFGYIVGASMELNLTIFKIVEGYIIIFLKLFGEKRLVKSVKL